MDTLFEQLADRPSCHAIGVAIKAGNTEAALRSVEYLVQRIFCEPLNTALVFADPLLDATCQWLGHERLQTNRAYLALGSSTLVVSSRQVVCVVSRLQRSGGHTAVLADILSSPDLVGAPVTVLLTGVGGATAASALSLRFGHLPQVQFERAPRFSRLRKLDWLQKRLCELKPRDVWLVNHHQDSVAVAAVQPEQGYNLHYLHHGDHHLCLGVHLGFGTHVDLHPMGFRNCRVVLGLAHNTYRPLSTSDLGLRLPIVPVGINSVNASHNSKLVTCTAAGSNKIAVPYWISYLQVIPMVLAQTQGVHVHIGKLSVLYRLRMQYALWRQGIDLDRFRYVSHVDSVWRALHLYQVDLYLTSFPYGGAKTMVEVMGAGVPMAVHIHKTRPFLSAVDIAPVGSFFWRTPRELLEWLAAQNAATLYSFGRQARLCYERNHQTNYLQMKCSYSQRMALEATYLQVPVICTTSAQVPDSKKSREKTLLGSLRYKLYLCGRIFMSRFS